MNLRRPLSALLGAGVLLLPATAHAQRVPLEQIVSATGTVTVTWHGDPARGCAAAGVCDVSGVATLPADQSGLSFGGTVGAKPAEVSVELEQGTTRVVRGPLTDPLGVCVDRADADVTLAPRRGAGGSVTFVQRGVFAARVKGRCAGPLAADLKDVLPSATISAEAARRDHQQLRLRGTRPFVSGPYTGTVVTHLDADVDYGPADEEQFDPDGPPPTAGPVTTAPTMVMATFTFALQTPGGTLTRTFGGADGCATLDACGMAGTDTLTVPAAASTQLRLSTTISRSRLRGRGVSAVRDAILRRGVQFDGAGPADLAGGRWNRTVAFGGATTACGETAEPGPLSLESRRSGQVLRLALGTDRDTTTSAFLRCPGPGAALASDFVGIDPPPAVGDVPLATLLRGQKVTTTLRSPAAPRSADRGFRVQATGGIDVTLELTDTKVEAF